MVVIILRYKLPEEHPEGCATRLSNSKNNFTSKKMIENKLKPWVTRKEDGSSSGSGGSCSWGKGANKTFLVLFVLFYFFYSWMNDKKPRQEQRVKRVPSFQVFPPVAFASNIPCLVQERVLSPIAQDSLPSQVLWTRNNSALSPAIIVFYFTCCK